MATATTTPAITVRTSVTGVIKGNGTAVSAATAGTDYSAGTAALATGLLKSTTTTGALTIAVNSDLPVMTNTVQGAVPTPPNDGTKYLDGTGTWTIPAGGGGGGSGTVTSVSVASTNGFAGSVATATTTPVITLTTSLIGLLKGDGTGMSVATAGTDYLTPTGTETATNKTLGTGTILGANVTGGDYSLTRTMFKDTGYTFLDKGNSSTTTQTLDYTSGHHQKITATGNFTIATSNWPPTGNLGEMMLELTNGGAFTLTWPTINWIKSDGSFTTTFSANGVTLQSAGTDFAVIWTRDAGATLYGKFIR